MHHEETPPVVASKHSEIDRRASLLLFFLPMFTPEPETAFGGFENRQRESTRSELSDWTPFMMGSRSQWGPTEANKVVRDSS